MKLIVGKNIKKIYNKKVILRNVFININQGDIYGLIGRNGAGKTTLFKILTGLIPTYEGTVKIQKPCKIAAVINSPALFLNMTAWENLREQAKLLGIKEMYEIEKILELIGLENCEQKRVRDFSLGMLQRLKLGVALLEKPDVLFLDEPVNGLDPDGIAELRQLLYKLNAERSMTIVISSHILSELENIATCYGILNDGIIVKEFTESERKKENKSLEDIYMHYIKKGEATL